MEDRAPGAAARAPGGAPPSSSTSDPPSTSAAGHSFRRPRAEEEMAPPLLTLPSTPSSSPPRSDSAAAPADPVYRDLDLLSPARARRRWWLIWRPRRPLRFRCQIRREDVGRGELCFPGLKSGDCGVPPASSSHSSPTAPPTPFLAPRRVESRRSGSGGAAAGTGCGGRGRDGGGECGVGPTLDAVVARYFFFDIV